jgi:hypothetical protein
MFKKNMNDSCSPRDGRISRSIHQPRGHSLITRALVQAAHAPYPGTSGHCTTANSKYAIRRHKARFSAYVNGKFVTDAGSSKTIS